MTRFVEKLNAMSPRERSVLVQALGVQRSTLFRWRTGATMPERAVALRLVEYFDGQLTMDDIYRAASHGKN